MRVAGLTLGGDIEGTNAPDHLTVQGVKDHNVGNSDCDWRLFGGDMYDVTLDGVTTCNLTVNLEKGNRQGPSSGLTVRNSEFTGCTVPSNGCGNIKIDGADQFVFENNQVHDFQIVRGSGEHFECMFVSDVNGGTIRGNTFRNCVFYDIFFQRCNPANGGRCQITNLTIDSNKIGRVNNDQGGIRSTSLSFSPGNQGFTNILINGNTFDPEGGVSVNDDGTGAVYQNFRISNNIIGTTQCYPSATYVGNTYVGANRCE